MWRLPSLAVLVLLLCVSAFGQTSTTVSGTITDSPDGQAWFGGTYSFVFRTSPSNPTGQYFWNGLPFSTQQTIAGTLDASGHYSQSLPSNTSISPAGSTWDLTLTPLATSPSFTVQSITITGATQTVSPVPPAIRINMASPPPNTRAYTDAEMVAGALGQTYYNIIDATPHYCATFPCGWQLLKGLINVTVAPTGACTPGSTPEQVISTGVIYTCQGGTWAAVAASAAAASPVNSLQKNIAGVLGASNCLEPGSALNCLDDPHFRGPNLGVDVTVSPFNARAVSTSFIPATTGTITGGLNALVVASNSPAFLVGDGIALVGAGATNCTTPPAAPTGFAGLASSMTGTGHAVAGATGSTPYNYVVVAISQGGCYTAASPILTIANGNAALGATNIPITSCVNASGTVTCTVGSTTGLATGMWVRIGGTLDDGEFGGRHNITVLNGTQFTYASNVSSVYPMFSTTTSGGTLYFWRENHIVLPTLPAGTNLYKYAVYRCTGASCALPANAANYSLVYISYPSNLPFIDAAYNTWDDYGSISTVTSGLSAPWFIPTTPPATNVNDMLLTTITGIAGTAFTLAANATNSVAAASMRFDDAPAITACEAASNTTGAGGGGACHVPPPVQASIFGTTCYITSSYLIVNSILNVGGNVCPGETVELSGQKGALVGTYEDTVGSGVPGFGIQNLLSWICFGANPCIWRKGTLIKNLSITTSGPSSTLVFDNSTTPTLTENVQLNVPDGMGIADLAYNARFGGNYNNTSWTSGQAQVIGAVDTPLYRNVNSFQTTFNNISGSLRGLYFECAPNAPPTGADDCAFYITVRQGGNTWQGPITPLVTVNASSGGRFGWIYLEHMIQDSGAESIFVNASNAGALKATVIINGTDQPGRDTGAPLGDAQPVISGNPIFAGVSLVTDSPIIQYVGMNHDLFQCPQASSNTTLLYTGCALPSLNLVTASYSGNHTLNASEGIVNVTGTATITIPHALAGQTWQVFSKSGTTTLTTDSGTLFGNGATGPIVIPNNQGMVVSCDGIACTALGIGGGVGGGGSPGGTTDALQYNGGGSSFGGVNSPTQNGNYVVNYNVTASAAVPPTINLPGVPLNPQTGATYVEGSANTQSDRGTLITACNAGAQNYTLGNPSSAAFSLNYFNVLANICAGAVTENASGFTINGGASLVTPSNWLRWLWSNGVNDSATVVPTAPAFPPCLDTGGNHYNKDANGNLICGTSASGNGLSGMVAGQVPIAASATSVTSSEALAGAGAAIVTGPATSVSTDLVDYTGTAGQTADSGVLLANVWRKEVANVSAAVNHDFSPGTWKWPTGAGFTASATSMSGYDSTAKIPHCYVNNADGLCATTTSTSTTVTQVLHATAVPGVYAASAVVLADLPTPSFPLTVAGTVTSGGIPCFTSTTQESSSALLTINVLTKGSGAGACPTNSSITDNGTLISTTEGVSIAPTSTSQIGAIVNNPTSTSVDIADFQVNAVNKATIGNTGILTLGTATCTTLGTAGGICPAEGTAPTNVSGAAPLYPDSTTHEYMAATNGASSFGMLVRRQPGAIHQTAQTGSITTATLCAASAGACNVAGQYHLNFTFIETGTACSSVVAGSVTLQLTWTDSNGTAHSAVSIPMDDASSINTVSGSFHFATSLANAWASGDFNISTNGTVIQYATTYTACTTGTGTYQLDVAVTRVQ